MSNVVSRLRKGDPPPGPATKSKPYSRFRIFYYFLNRLTFGRLSLFGGGVRRVGGWWWLNFGIFWYNFGIFWRQGASAQAHVFRGCLCEPASSPFEHVWVPFWHPLAPFLYLLVAVSILDIWVTNFQRPLTPSLAPVGCHFCSILVLPRGCLIRFVSASV